LILRDDIVSALRSACDHDGVYDTPTASSHHKFGSLARQRQLQRFDRQPLKLEKASDPGRLATRSPDLGHHYRRKRHCIASFESSVQHGDYSLVQSLKLDERSGIES